jgi:hypothetical protein
MSCFIFTGWSDPNLWGTLLFGGILLALAWLTLLSLFDTVWEEPFSYEVKDYLMGVVFAVGVVFQFTHSIEAGLNFCVFMFFVFVGLLFHAERISHGRHNI